jgi:hypothetical protein
MKKVAREVVSTKYVNSLSSDFEGGNQLEMYKMVKDGVTGLLSEGRFLRGGFDENVGLFFSQVFVQITNDFPRVKPRISVMQL